MKLKTDEGIYKEAKERAGQLMSSYSGQSDLYDQIEAAYFLEPLDKRQMQDAMSNVKLTISPDARNDLLGAVRLMIGTDPVFSVPGDEDSREIGDQMEKFADRMWGAAGKVAGTPIHYDAVLSGLLYGRVHAGITSTKEMLKYAAGRSAAYKARAEEIAKRTPFLYNIWNPRDCYPEYDSGGLVGHYRRVQTTVGKVRGTYGEQVDMLAKKKSTDTVTLCEWWDLENQAVWVEGEDRPILSGPHNLPFIPIVATVTEGSTALFAQPYQQVQPFLYTFIKSGLWNRQNLALTVLYTMTFAIGANPMFLYQTPQPGKQLAVDYSRPGGMVTIQSDESYSPLLKQVIDPSLMQALQIANDKGTESTLYKQALGQPLGANAPFSMVALLSQAGRLPLISPQRKISWAIAQLMEISFKWMKYDGGGARKIKGGIGPAMEFKPSDIPDDFEFDVKLDISLPQDQLQSANIANLLTQGENPLVSLEWVRENVLNIGQSGEMTKEIWNERAAQMLYVKYLQDQLQGRGGGPTMPQGQPSITPNATTGSLPSSATEQSLVGLPPEMAQNGGQPPVQPGNMPAGL